MNAGLEELRAMENELRETRRMRQEAEEARFVGVQFHGNARIYTYEMAPGQSAEVGDYVAVHSPRTMQTELVRVVRKGRGSWTLGFQIARSIDVTVHGC